MYVQGVEAYSSMQITYASKLPTFEATLQFSCIVKTPWSEDTDRALLGLKVEFDSCQVAIWGVYL